MRTAGAAQNPTASFGPSGYGQNFDILRQNQANQTAMPGVLNRVDLAPFTAVAAPNALTGWRWRQGGTQTAFSRDNGSTATGQGYSYGNNFNDNEAALGNVAGSLNANTYFGVILRNNTGAAVSSVVVSYVGEQWRSSGRGDGTADGLQFGYALTSNELPNTFGATTVPALDFASPGWPGRSTATSTRTAP